MPAHLFYLLLFFSFFIKNIWGYVDAGMHQLKNNNRISFN